MIPTCDLYRNAFLLDMSYCNGGEGLKHPPPLLSIHRHTLTPSFHPSGGVCTLPSALLAFLTATAETTVRRVSPRNASSAGEKQRAGPHILDNQRLFTVHVQARVNLAAFELAVKTAATSKISHVCLCIQKQ